MSQFAKLFGPPEDQVVVMLKEGDDYCAEVRFYVQPKGLGVCSAAVGYEKGDAGWDKAEAYFARVDEAEARDAVRTFLGKFAA